MRRRRIGSIQGGYSPEWLILGAPYLRMPCSRFNWVTRPMYLYHMIRQGHSTHGSCMPCQWAFYPCLAIEHDWGQPNRATESGNWSENNAVRELEWRKWPVPPLLTPWILLCAVVYTFSGLHPQSSVNSSPQGRNAVYHTSCHDKVAGSLKA